MAHQQEDVDLRTLLGDLASDVDHFFQRADVNVSQATIELYE